jgi:hypothetical protein
MFFNKCFLFLIIASEKYHHPRVKFVSLGAEPVVPRIEETILDKSCDEVRLSPMKTTASSLAAPSPTTYTTPQPQSPQPAACKCQPVNEINTRIDQLSR